MASPLLAPLEASVSKARTVISSAVTLINGISQRVSDAVAAAISNGATAEELQPVADLGVALSADADALASAVQANTPGGSTGGGIPT